MISTQPFAVLARSSVTRGLQEDPGRAPNVSAVLVPRQDGALLRRLVHHHGPEGRDRAARAEESTADLAKDWVAKQREKCSSASRPWIFL